MRRFRVGYSGLQERARNSARIQTASQAQTALQLLFLRYTEAQIRTTMHDDTTGTDWVHVCVGACCEDGECTGNGHIYRESDAFNALLSEVSDFNATADYPTPLAATDLPYAGRSFKAQKLTAKLAGCSSILLKTQTEIASYHPCFGSPTQTTQAIPSEPPKAITKLRGQMSTKAATSRSAWCKLTNLRFRLEIPTKFCYNTYK